MGSLPRVSVVSGPRSLVPTAPLTKHLARLANSENTALVYADETSSVCVTYNELAARTNALARAITSRARPSGTNRDGDYVIAVCMQPTHNTIMTLLATWKAGAAYVPMEPSFPQARISHILKDAEPALIIYDDTANPGMFSASGVPAVSFEELSHEASGISAENIQDGEVLSVSRNDSIAIVLYTSGSTGVPKGVRLPYSAICNRLWWQFHTFPYADTETNCVWKTALTFVDSVCEIWGPLLHGRTLWILSRETIRDPQKLVKLLSENQIQRLVLVPTLLRSILMYLSLKPSERPLQHLKLWVCSGETLSKDLAAQFFKYFGDHNGYKLANFYGSTEVMGDVTYYVLEKTSQLDIHPTVPIGAPLDNCAVYLLDEEMNPARESEPGEVWVSGCNLAAGYVGGQGADKFVDNPHAAHPDFGRLYRTGDFGVLQKGMVLFAGRTDSQVKIRGHRVDLQEVDRAVNSIKGVDKCVVLCYGLERGNPEILSFVTLDPAARTSAHHVEAQLKNCLTHYMIPQVIEIETVPLLVNGKVDRQALLKMYENTNNNDDSEIPLDLDYSSVKPEDMAAAKVLFETVGEVLGRAARGAISVRAGFYELGGNSLNSIYTITRLRDQGYYIEISDFLGAANLGEVLSHMSTDPNSSSDEDEPQFTAEPLADEHKDKVIEMIVSSFYNKAELEQFLKHEIDIKDYAGLISETWLALLEARLSVVLKDESSSPVAVALNFDARAEPDVDVAQFGGLMKIMMFLEFVEGSVRDSMLPPGTGTVLHSFMMATAEHLSPRDNVAAIRALENATMNIASERGFKGVFTTNTSPLTQQLGTDVLGYKTLLDYQINQYVDPSGERIFGKAPDDMRAIVCWKPLE
ncbi:nonribosomal peptide synthetase ebony [Anticarsia gemmatalis]|uniref:nonribosomal peptide synthetase ebony n=1 Tax=Anticarsia gemmatalis TaxID=129554 RepID=UPI003F765B08